MAGKQQKKLGAEAIVRMLEKRHDKELFVAECNTGSAMNGCRRMDAWVLCRTYSPMTTIGYEVKVSRSDFLGDNKWQEYLPYCHQLSFVCPAKLIHREELPADIGLIWVSQTGNRLITKRKAVRREPDDAALLRIMTYVLMSRSVIAGNMWMANAKMIHGDRGEIRRAEVRRYLEDMRENKMLGNMVSQHIRERYKEMERRVLAAEQKEKAAQELCTRLKAIGVTWNGTAYNAPTALREIDQLAGRIDHGVQMAVQSARHKLDHVLEVLEDIRRRAR